MATEVDTPESISTMQKSGREEKELLSEVNYIEFPSDEQEKPESRTNQYLEASSYEGQPINTPLVINIKVADVTEDTVGTNQDECFFKSPPVSEVATDESSSIPRDSAPAKIQNKTGLFNIETLEKEILKDQTVQIDPPKEACSDNELKPSREEEPEESLRDERASLKVDEVVTLANSGQFIDSLQLIGVSETKEVCNYTTTGRNSTSDSVQGIKYKRGNINEVESEEIEKKSEQHELLHDAKEDDCIPLTDHNAEEAMENDNATKEKIGRLYINALTEENSSEEAGTESGRHSQSFNNETKENIDEMQVKEHNLIFLPKYEIGMENGYRSIDGASDRTEETVPYFKGQSQIGSPDEILKQEISQKMIHVHEICEKGSPEVKAKEKYENDGLKEEIEGRNTEESSYKANLPFSATGEETAEEKLKEDETDGPKPKEVKNLGMESVQSLDTKCHIESKIAEDMTDDINPDEDCHTQSSRGLSEETQLKETSEDLVGSSSIPQVSLKETDDNNMEKTLSLTLEETSIKEVERKRKTELDTSNLLFEEKSRETETESDDVNSTSKLTEASKIGENTNIQISESAKNEVDEAGTMRESLGETHTTLPEGEDEKEATSCETPSSALSDQTLQESSVPLIAESKLGTTEVSEMIDDNPDHEVFHINIHNPLTAETTGEKLEQNEFEPMAPINGNLVELIDIPMGSVHAAEKNPESVEPQKPRSFTILVAKVQSSETFIEVNQTKMDEDIESVIEHNLGSADTNAKEKIFGGNYQEFQKERSKEVECKSEAERPIERTKSGIETVNDVVLIEELLGEVEKVEETENIKEQMVEEEKGATKLQMAFSSDKVPNKLTDSDLIATQNHEAAGIIENIEISGSQVVEDINWEPEAYSITKAPEEEMITAAEKPTNNTSSPYGLLNKKATEANVGIHREKAETAPATVMTLEIRSDGVQLVNISASDLNAITSDNSLGVHGTVQGEAADNMEPKDSSEISPCTTTEHADVNKRTMVIENPVTNENEVEELITSVAKEITSITETAKLQEAENINWEPEASAITQAPEDPEEEIMKNIEKHIITSSKFLPLEENVREEKMEVGNQGGKAETTVAPAMTAETACGGAQLANNSTSDSDKAVAENNLRVHSPQDEATANLEFEGNYVISQLTTAEHTEVNKEPLAVDNPATDETQFEEVKISLAERTIGDTETAKLQAVDDIKRDPEASSITKTQEEELMKAEKPTNISSSAMALSEEDSREEKLEKVGVHEDDSETKAAPMMTAERSSAEVQPANKSARDLDTTADENSLKFHTTTLEGEAVSYVELEDFSERCQLTTTEYVDVYNDTMVLEKQATAETEIEEVKISNAYPIVSNVETAKLQVVEDINWEPEASTLTKAPDEEMTKGAEKPINITSSASELSEECSREEMIEEVGNLGEDTETAEATSMTAATGSEGVQLDNVSARDLVTSAGENSLGFHTTLEGEVDDNMELLDSSIMPQLTKPKHGDVYKETMMLEKSATDETGVEELQISNAEPNSSEQYVHHIHESDEISTTKSSEMHTCEEVTIVEALAEGDKVPNLTHAAGYLIKQFQGPSSATTAEKVEDEIPMEKETLVNELELELVEDKRIDGSGESAKEEPTYLKEATSEEPQKYISIIQSAESSPGSQEELEDIRHFSSLEPSKEDTLDSAELNKEKELETVGENENISDESKADEDPYRNSNKEGADNNSCSQEAGGRNVEEAPIRLDRPETKAPNEENVESHEEPRSASISKVDKQLNRTTSVPKKVDAGENSINDEGKLDSTEIKVSEQDSNDVEMESNEAGLENEINTREDCIETSKDVIFFKEVEQVTVEKSEDIKRQICEQDTCTQELQKTTSSQEVLNETTYSDPVPIEKLEATNLSPEMKQGTEKLVDGSKSVLEGSEEDNGEEKIKEAAIVNRTTDIPPETLVSETSSEDVQLGEKFMKDSDTENQIEKATEVNETAEDTLVYSMIAEDDKVVKSFLATNSIPIEEIAYLDPEPTEYREAIDLNVETEREKLRAAEYLNWESETSSITKSPEKEAKKGTEKPADNTSPVIDVPAEKSRELKSEANIINTSTATRPGTLVTLLSLEEVQQGEMLIKGSDMKSTDENSNIKMTHTSQEDEEVDRLKLEETFVGKKIVTAENPAKEDEAKEIFFDTVSTSIEQDPKDVLDMDKVQHELTEVQEFIDEKVIQDFKATDSTPIQELSEELQRVDVEEKAEEHVTSAGSAVVEFYQESVTEGTVNENLAQETNEENTINENPSDLEQQETGQEPEYTQIKAKTTVEEVAYSDPVPTGYLKALDLNVYAEREKLRDEENLNWESEASFITKAPENEEKKCTENSSSVIDVPEEKGRELKSETDVFCASTAIQPGSPEMEMSLEEVKQGEMLIKGSDMKSTDENLNIKMTHTSQEDEDIDSMKFEEILSGNDIVFAEEQNANEGEPEEIVTSDTISTSIEQDPKDVLDMDKVQHELTEVPKFITENKEVTKDFMVANSITVQELSEELQRVDAVEKSKDHDTGAGMPGSAVVDIYHESVAEGTANENLAQETNEEKTVMETPCDMELQETGEESEHKEINAETTVLAKDTKKSGSSDIAYSDTVLTGYLEAIDLNVETESEELRGAEDLNLESEASSITKPTEIEEKKGIEKPVDITSSVLDVPEKKSKELKSDTDIFNASTAIPPGTLVMERSLEEVQQGGALIKGSDMKSTDENVNTKMTHADKEDKEDDSVKLEETFVMKEIVNAKKPAVNKDETEEILTSDLVSTSIEQNPQDGLDMDNVQPEVTEVPGFVAKDKEVTKDFMVSISIPIQELSEELHRVDAEEKSKDIVTGAGMPGSAVLNIYHESVAEGTANENLAQETKEEKTVMETPCDLEQQETGEEPENTEINAETTVLAEDTKKSGSSDIAYSDTVLTGYLEAIDLNAETESEELRGAEELNLESKASSITKPPEIGEKKGIEKPVDITSSVIDVPEKKSKELKSDTDIFNASTAIPPGTLVMERSLEEVKQDGTLIKGSDMKSTDENVNSKMTHADQEDEEVDSVKLEETFVVKEIVVAKKPDANKDETEEILTSDTVSTSFEQNPQDVLNMDDVQHELTEVPGFIAEYKEVTKDLMATDSFAIQELSEELQRVDEEEKSEDIVTSAGMQGSAVLNIYHESVAEGTANENLAQEANEKNTVMETPCDLELQETGEEPENTEINAENTVLAEDTKKSGSSDIAYSDTVLTGYLEAIDLNAETESEELRGAEELNLESKASSIAKPTEIEEKKGIEKPVDITSSVIDVPEKKSKELKSDTDIFNASTAIPAGTLVIERSLEEVQQGGTLIKGSDMKSTDENVNSKMTHADQEDEEVDSVKLEETFVVKEIVVAKKPDANKDETEEILTSDIVSTSIEQNPQDVLDMDDVQHELTEVPGFIAEDKEVTKDLMATDSFAIQELSEELQRVDAEEKSEDIVAGAGMPGSAVVDIYHESVAEGTANENLAQETNEKKTVMETPCDLEQQETGEDPAHMEINAETTVLVEDTKKSGSSDIAYSDTVPTGYLEAIYLNVETKREDLRGAEDLNWEPKASSITKPPEIEERKGIEKPVDITSSVIDVPEKKSKELKSETDIFNASTAIPPGTLVMERSLEEAQQGGTLIKGSDMKSTDENVNTKITHADQEDEEVDSIKLEETFVVKEIVVAKKPDANKDETKEILTSDTVSTSNEQNPQDVLDMDDVQHELTEVPGFIAEDKEVTKDLMATNSFAIQELSEELQRVALQEKSEEHVTRARSAVVDVHQESVAKGTANEHVAQETNEENIVKEAPSDLELQSTVEEPECIEINAETTVLTEENVEAVEPHDELLSAHEYVADGQIDEPLPQTNKSNGKDSNDQNLESTIEKIIEQDYLEDQSETNEFVEHKFEETQGGHETMKDLILVEKAVVDIQEVEEAGYIMEDACCIQELKRISESDEKTSKRINSETIPIDNLEAIGSITDTEEVELMTSEDLSWNSGSPFAIDAPEEDKKQGIKNTSCNISSEFEVSKKMVKEESMEKADADPNKESENLNNPDAEESEVDKSIHFDAVSKSKKKVMEDIQRNGEGVTAVSIGMHKAIEAVVGPDKILDLADLATNLPEKFHEPLSEMLHKEQTVETTTTTKNREDKSLQKDATLLNECVEDTLSTRTMDAALLQKETPKGLQLTSPGLELDAVKQNKSPNEAATDEWTVVEEAAAVEPQEDIYKMKIEDSLIPSPTYILGNAVENFKEDPIQDFQKAEKVLESTLEARLSAVTKSKVAEIEEEHHKRAMTARIDGEIQNEITDETTGTIKKEILSEKTTPDEEVAKDSLVVSADEEKIRSSYHEDESETVEYPEETTIQKLETTKIVTHVEELDPTTDIEEQTLAESTRVKEVHQDFLGDRTVITIHPEEINDEKNVKGVPTIINLQEESYETNSRDTNTEDATIIEEVNISEVEVLKYVEDQAHSVEKNNLTPEVEVLKYVEDRAHSVEKNNLTPNYEAQSTHPEASANEKVGEAEDVFAIAQNHPVQEIIEVHRANTNTKKEYSNISDCLVDTEKPEHTPAESTFDRNIGPGSLNQREQEKAKEYLAISHKDGIVATEMALGVQMLEKAYVSMLDKQIMNEADSNENSKPEVSTGSKDDPLKREDLITKTLDAEVETLRAENDSKPELESNSADTGEGTIMIDEVKEQTEKPESTMISLSELRNRSTKGTSQVAKRLIEESETTDEKGLQADKVDSDEDKGAKEEEEGGENQKADSGSDAPVMVEASRDMEVKVCKKSHGILSGVGSKVKHSISKVKKVITGKSSHPKQSSPNKGIQ